MTIKYTLNRILILWHTRYNLRTEPETQNSIKNSIDNICFTTQNSWENGNVTFIISEYFYIAIYLYI